ncbi:MAG TPA: hypothetical protein VHO50_01210 [Bacteroidales bacterium]|nr:hypothetical protein [Bacteroidales bacterium]
MDFNATIDLIIRELDEACDILEDLKQYPETPALQVELARSKCKNAAGVIALLKSIQPIKADEKQKEQKDPQQQEQKTHIDPAAVTSNPKVTDPEYPTDQRTPETKPFVAPIIADTFSHLSNEYQHGQQVSDLSTAIGINDRFYYIREIFNDNRDKYNQMIKDIEGAKSFEEANEIILHFKNEKTNADALKQLLDLVKRKFSK